MDKNEKHFVAIKVSKSEYKHFQVPEPVYKYIIQLEQTIQSGDYTGIKKLYPKFKPKK